MVNSCLTAQPENKEAENLNRLLQDFTMNNRFGREKETGRFKALARMASEV